MARVLLAAEEEPASSRVVARLALTAGGHTVEQAYDGNGQEAYRCVNKRFFDWPDAGRDAVRAFDLRDRCEP